MEHIAPRAESFTLPEGSHPTVIAANQSQYNPLLSLRTPDGKVISQWLPTAEELAALNAGEPLTLILWTFNKPLQPIFMCVGGLDLTERGW